jgi:hypothetical protein
MQRKQAAHAVGLFCGIDQPRTFVTPSGTFSDLSLITNENAPTNLSGKYPGVQKPSLSIMSILLRP